MSLPHAKLFAGPLVFRALIIKSPNALANSSLAPSGICRKTLTSFLNFRRRSYKVI